ncbi:hypothetical protein F3157_20245 [Virgibacillus dakarensis]|uniref:WYL domain-containing protein n=1 Tax=Lentibacillus populi TaxID=1827502 RepID=A0A9W5X7P8_9BACI|nr:MULTISPECIES: hypothetical protein [Bacillaceae]MBT2214656.1 hypothetical protein [Virgibacillus dakarensis]MTW87948.1 hypothetical protein [Virgibacillus dakarensis]GGB58293.1 hypothetical protein GCM10011409_39720 [Lentibacillus populi]
MTIKPGSTLELIYLDSNNQITQRTIKVLRTNNDTVLAFCYTKRQVRTFKRNNILSVGPIRKRVGA